MKKIILVIGITVLLISFVYAPDTCLGTASTCASLGFSPECGDQSGCSSNPPECSGGLESSPCWTYNKGDCEAEPLCSWSGSCSPSYPSCSIYISSQSDCEFHNCAYTPGFCSGTATTCSFFDSIFTCGSTTEEPQYGCYWGSEADSCTYGGSGTWTITDNCTINILTDVGRNDIIISGELIVHINTSKFPYNFSKIEVSGGAKTIVID